MFRESMIDPLARFRSIDQNVETLREAVSQVKDAREMIRASEASAVREKVLRSEVLDFLDHATRQAANVIKDLQESKTTVTDARVQRDMIEFLDHTRAVAERLINDLKNERRKILQRAQATLKSEKQPAQRAPARHAAPQPARGAKAEAGKERQAKPAAAPRKASDTANASLKSIVEKPSRRKKA
ncbi:MAG: hypothetical protein IPN34_03525 [Planctomycetes bacterium]|nr:hypothetical protein [Planctomycetota bacterium]